MGTTRPRRLGPAVILAVIVAAGLSVWYAHARGWLDPAYAWVRHLAHQDSSRASDR